MDAMQLLHLIYDELSQLKQEFRDIKSQLELIKEKSQQEPPQFTDCEKQPSDAQQAALFNIPRRLTYNIQNLNVTTLSGTLNVGLVTGTTEGDVLKHLTGFGVETEDEPQEASQADSKAESAATTTTQSTQAHRTNY